MSLKLICWPYQTEQKISCANVLLKIAASDLQPMIFSCKIGVIESLKIAYQQEPKKMSAEDFKFFNNNQNFRELSAPILQI